MTVAEGSLLACRREGASPPLQWGRNLTVAEGAMRDADRAETALLQWGRNLTVAEGSGSPWRILASRVCFNGAAT